MQNPTPSYKSKQGLFCPDCMETTHIKRLCRYLNGCRSHSKQGGQETDVRTMRKPNQKRISMLSEVSGLNFTLQSPPQSKEVSKGNHDLAALDTILPDELLAKIFSFLPMTSIIRASTVCKRWYNAVRERKYDSWIGTRAQKPWYCMFDYYSPVSTSYNPVSKIWYKSLCPLTLLPNRDIISSSYGLLCFMLFPKHHVFIHNPITEETKKLPELEGEEPKKYCRALSLSVDRRSPHSYTVAVVKIDYGEYRYERRDLTIQIYESESKMWVTRARENLQGWNGSNECMICDKVLYYMIHWHDKQNPRVGLIMHDLSTSGEASTSLMSTLSLLPPWLSWARLININDRVIVVGGNCRDPFGIEKMGIWELHKRSVWEEINQVPGEFVRRFRKSSYSQNYTCCGAEGLIYIHGSQSHDLLTFDMTTKQWGWETRFPVPKNSVYKTYYGFCFQPCFAKIE